MTLIVFATIWGLTVLLDCPNWNVTFSCVAKPNSELDQPEQLGDAADEPGHEAGPAGRRHQHGAVAGGLQGRVHRL